MSRPVSDLAGADLALWVALANKNYVDAGDGVFDADGENYIGHIGGSIQAFAPHEDWAQGGPLIEKHALELETVYETRGCGVRVGLKYWYARHPKNYGGLIRYAGYGPTPLIAAMRALVASVYGDMVPDEVLP